MSSSPRRRGSVVVASLVAGFIASAAGGCGSDSGSAPDAEGGAAHACPPAGYEWTFEGANFACVDVHLPQAVPVDVQDIDTTNAKDAFTNRCEPAWPAAPDRVYHFVAPEAGTYEIAASMPDTAPDSHAIWFVTGDCDAYVKLGRMGLVSFGLSFAYEMAAGDHLLVVFERGRGGTLTIRSR